MLFVTTTIYALAKRVGMAEAPRTFALQCQAPDRDCLPVVRTLSRLRIIDECQIRIDCGSGSLPKTRSRAFHAALESGADVWVACDDDVECTQLTLRWLIEAARTSDGVCLVPYYQRNAAEDKVALVAFPPGAFDKPRGLSVGGMVVPALYGGFGLVAVSRHAMVEIAAQCTREGDDYLDDDGVVRLAVFRELFVRGDGPATWWGEDLSFFKRLPACVTVEALVTGESSHEGQVLKLENLRR